MDTSSQFIVPTIIDVPELIVTNEHLDYDDSLIGGSGLGGGLGGGGGGSGLGGGGGLRNGFLWNKLQFLSSALSYTINLGNLWRFPYLCHKHAGGAFLIAYTLILILVGLPLVLMEMAFGQYANEGPITIWRISPAFEGIGYSMCLVSVMVAIYFNAINAWLLHYLFASITFGPLPWSGCDNSWNTRQCFLRSADELDPMMSANKSLIMAASNCSSAAAAAAATVATTTELLANDSILLVNNNNNNMNMGNTPQQLMNFSSSSSSIADCNRLQPFTATNLTASSFDKILNTTTDVVLPANEYFHNQVLELTRSIGDWGSLNGTLLFNLSLLWLIDFVVLLKQFRPQLTSSSNTFGQNKLILMLSLLMPYLCLLALLARALTLPGSWDGLNYLVSVDWARLQNIDIWLDSTTQLLFSMSPCWGGLITLANMNKFHTNFHSNTMLIVAINYASSLLVGLVSFAILGFMAQYSGIALDQVVEPGIGFVFMVFSEILVQLPLAPLNACLFFGVILFLGFQHQLTVIDTVLSTIVDTWPHKLRYRRPLVLVCLCSLMFLASLFVCFGNGLYVMLIFDTFSGTFAGILIGILQLIAIAWVYGMENFVQDIDDMISFHRQLFPSRAYWCFMWRYLTPSVLFAILLFSFTDLEPPQYRAQQLPGWTMRLGWLLTLACVSLIPILAFIRFLLSPSGSFVDKISYLCRPSEDWAPSSYVSGPKLINRHQMLDDHASGDGGGGGPGSPSIYVSSSHHAHNKHRDQRQPGAASAYSSVRNHDDDEDDHGGHVDQGDQGRHQKRHQGANSMNVGGRGGRRDEDDLDDDEEEDEEDLKVVNGRANYIIPEEEDDTDTGLISTNETNV